MATFPIRRAEVVRRPVDQQEVDYYPVDASASFIAGAFVTLQSDGEIAECGSDPTAILGIAVVDSDASLSPSSFTGKTGIPVEVIREGTILEMTMSGAWAGTEIGSAYGIAKDSGSGGTNHWYVDRSDTTNTRVRILGLVNNIRTGERYAVGDTNVRVYVQVLPSYRQLP